VSARRIPLKRLRIEPDRCEHDSLRLHNSPFLECVPASSEIRARFSNRFDLGVRQRAVHSCECSAEVRGESRRSVFNVPTKLNPVP